MFLENARNNKGPSELKPVPIVHTACGELRLFSIHLKNIKSYEHGCRVPHTEENERTRTLF